MPTDNYAFIKKEDRRQFHFVNTINVCNCHDDVWLSDESDVRTISDFAPKELIDG